ncbi:zinc finger CCCH domain-containing protein 62-like [Pollicipes pollicipes]|uniref:zinc finger CCCH domain-containing protein 62-like n=1 Tax=Pollicipes pollicipes TaxID=41117 RepID=UPI00188581BC|nr:zinc finger CCCH domain-containing protein 62-like [Pollicipes pollicipes]
MSLNIVASVTEETKQSGDVVAMVYHNGKLFTGAEGGKLIIYNADLTIHQEIQAQYNTVNSMCIFNGDLVTTGNDGLVKIWDVNTLELKKTLTGHDNEVRKLLPTPDRLYSGDMSGKVKIWGTDGAGQFTLNCVEEVWDIAVAGSICFTVRDKDITCSEVMFRETSAGDTKFVILTSFEGRPPLMLVGNTLCFCDRPGMVIKLKANEKGQPDLGQLEGHTKIITAMASRGNYLYSGGYDNSVRIWDVPAKKLVATGTTVSNAVQSLAVGDDGSVFAGLVGGYIVKMKQQ